MCRASFLPPLGTGNTERETGLQGGYANSLERIFRIKLRRHLARGRD